MNLEQQIAALAAVTGPSAAVAGSFVLRMDSDGSFRMMRVKTTTDNLVILENNDAYHRQTGRPFGYRGAPKRTGTRLVSEYGDIARAKEYFRQRLSDLNTAREGAKIRQADQQRNAEARVAYWISRIGMWADVINPDGDGIKGVVHELIELSMTLGSIGDELTSTERQGNGTESCEKRQA